MEFYDFEKVADDIESGEINPLDVFKEAKKAYDLITSEFERIKEYATEDAETRGKQELMQMGYEYFQGRKMYEFDEDKEYSEIKSDLKKREDEIKAKGLVSEKYSKHFIKVVK